MYNATLFCFSLPPISLTQSHLWVYLSFTLVFYKILCGTPFFSHTHTVIEEILSIPIVLINSDLPTPSYLPLLKFSSYAHLLSGQLHLCFTGASKLSKSTSKFMNTSVFIILNLIKYNKLIKSIKNKKNNKISILNNGAGPRNLNSEQVFVFHLELLEYKLNEVRYPKHPA